MDNQQVCHNFFYSGFNETYRPHYMNIGYKNEYFFSYNTAIGKVVKSKYEERILLISENDFSNTTRRHIGLLWNACLFSKIEVICERDIDHFSIADCVYNLLEALKSYSVSDFTRKPNRESFIRRFSNLNELLYNFDFSFTTEQKELYKELQQVYNDLQNSDAVKKIKQKEREKKQNALKEFKELIKNNNIVDLAEMAYSRYSQLDYQQKVKIKKKLNPLDNLSFVWFEDGYYKTSQGVRVSKLEGNILLTLFDKGKLKHGHKIDCYTVLSVDKDYVKIGCHKIPVENLKALCEQLPSKQQNVA